MDDMLILSPMPNKPSRDRLIREQFDAVGGSMTTAAFARHCINVGIWTDEELGRFQLQHAQAEVRKVLKKADESGLPWAGQTTRKDEGSPVWSIRPLWDYEDYALNVTELVGQRDTLHWEAVALAQECFDRYGRRPDLSWPGDVGKAAD